jgi:hypothetical protein
MRKAPALSHRRASVGRKLCTPLWIAICAVVVCGGGFLFAQEVPPARRIPRQPKTVTGAVEVLVHDETGHGVPGANVVLRDLASGKTVQATAGGDGVVRFRDLAPSQYKLEASGQSWLPYRSVPFEVTAGEVKMLAITLLPSPSSTPGAPWHGVGPPPSAGPELAGKYRELERADTAPAPVQPQPQPSASDLFVRMPDRWDVAMPEWDRYPAKTGEFPYVEGHWWDPFNRNKIKGDYPILGQQTFLNFTATSDSFLDPRRLPVPSGVSAANPGSFQFFGQGGEFFLSQTFRFSFDLFHGDTAYRPVDWRIQITPAVNVNFLATRELGVVSPDVRQGTTRPDAHLGLQEGFFEYRLHDLGPNFDFVSVRLGIQQFSSDFRGFLFVDEQPGIRLFGNLRSNRFQYNLAYFYMLEKDTNSLLNTFQPRNQQVAVANLYVQDFLWKGYTNEFSFHFNRDQADVRYDTNGFLVRPAPIGAVAPHQVDVAYAGWASNGHIGRLNVSHAIYEALGHDDLNPIARRPVFINAQMAALELSVDKNWTRFRTAFLYASGDANPNHGPARGFDSIVDSPVFAGGIFSFFNREAIPLTSTGVELTGIDSFLPDLRPNKFEGQANFVNPGLFLFNAGTDFDLKPKLQTFLNANFMRFAHTQPLELLLFQRPIDAGLGADYSIGFKYRPPLTDNMVLTTGVSALTPFSGLREIYSGRVLFSTFANVRLRF